MKKIFFLLAILIVFIGLTKASPSCETYDDFSSGILDTNKWTEETFHGDPFNTEHFIDNNSEVYHIEQTITGTGQTNLVPTRQFISGESFSFETIYNGGIGNHFSQPLINGNYPPSQIESCTASGGCGPIGFWNGVPDLGNEIGTYKIKFEFANTQVKMTSITPNNTTIINTFTGNSEPYTFAINTHTGHNGLLHFDYDNFILCTPNNPPLLQPIENIQANELQTVTIIPNATDPEGDSITFSINDSRFSWNEASQRFEWKTNQTDSGDYIFQIEANDGTDSSYEEANVIVKDTCKYEDFVNSFICLYPFPKLRIKIL